MKNGAYKKYLYWALTVLGVVTCSSILFFILFRMGSVRQFFATLTTIFKPFIYGLVMAYLLLPVFNFADQHIEPFFHRHMKSPLKAKRVAKACSTAISILFLLLIITGLIWMVLPQLVTSVVGLVDTLPDSFRQATQWLQTTLANNPKFEDFIVNFSEEAVTTLTQWVKIDMLPQLNNQLNSVMNGLWDTITFFKDILVGLFVCIYVLNSKELFAAQSKKMTYSIFSVPRANLIIDNFRFVHRVFGGFINGKLLDSFIIGIICFIGMSVFHLPYAMLISVIIGVTNIIPFFGPFIGAIPSTLLILLSDPFAALKFLIFILVLQQFDGNILGPKILGDSTGLSSFWVMFAILAFGGFFGFTGMVIGVPLFAVIYSLVSGLVNRSLRRRALTDDTHAYFGLNHIESDHTLCYERGETQTRVKTSIRDDEP